MDSRKRKAHDYSDDDDDDDAEDEDTRAAAAGGAKRGKRGAAAGTEGGFSIEDLPEDEREKLEKMTELDREMYLFEREEQLQRQRQRQAVLDQTKRNREVEVRASRSRQRAQTGTDSAIGKIAAAHAQREAREKRKQQEAEQRQGKQQRGRGRKQAQEEEEQELPEEEEEYSEEEEASEEEEEQSKSVGSEMEAEEEEEEAAGGKGLGARAEVFDEGANYEELEENAKLEEIQSIQLTRSQLEAWHNEPFFEADLPGCVLRIVPNLGPNVPRASQPQYMLARVEGVVQRNSYAFPKPPERTRKWLHLDDLTGAVFRHQMNMVSNSLITQQEYEKAIARAQRVGAKFITKGDVQQALEKLHHARNFKYDSALVKQMLQKKRAQGKVVGGFTQTRARLAHEIILAQQEGRPDEEILRLREELDRLEQQHRMRMEEEEEMLAAAVEAEKGGSSAAAAVLGTRVKPSMALALVNMRNRDRNAFKTLNAAPGSALATAAAASLGGSNTADVFSRRHTVSKVYWATKKRGEGQGAEAAQQQEQQQQLLRRTSSGAADVEQLKGSLKRMDPAELIKVLDLNIDLSALPKQQQDLLPKRVLGPRWYQTTDKRQQKVCAGRRLISLDEWRQRTSDQREGV